jgi:hypothetical protein
LAELGIVAAQGREGLKQLLTIIADEKDARLPIDARASLIVLAAQLQRKKRLSDGRMRLCPCFHELQGVMTTLMQTRFGSREERARGFDWDRSADHISARSQNGCTLEAGYIAAPVSFREKVRFFSLAPRAPSRHERVRIAAVQTDL